MAKKAKVKVEDNGEYRVVMVSHGKKEFVQKKVIAMGKTREQFSGRILADAMAALKKSHDFIIGDDEGGIRVYMIVGANGKLKVLAQTYGNFRECMESAKWAVDEKCKISFDEARKRDMVNAELRRITPDTTITVECEKCGHPNTVRVGKRLV